MLKKNKKKTTPTILVTDAGRSCAISIIRSLGRQGWHIIAGDSNPWSPGFHSRFAKEKLLYPPPESAPDKFLTTVYDAVCKRGIDLIFPVTDNVILPLAQSRDKFESVCQLAIPAKTAMDATGNKLETFALAKQLNVPYPQTRLVHTVEEALDQGPRMKWPLVLKPQVSHLYRDGKSVHRFSVSYAHNPDGLAHEMQQFAGLCPVLLQEYSPGTGHGVEVLMHKGRPLAAFQHQRLREVPLSGGASALRQSVPLDPVLYNYTLKMLAALKWTGLAMAEFKVGEDGAKLMEINGRVWGSLPLAIFSGIDFPARLVELCLFGSNGCDDFAQTTYKVGVRAHSIQKELSWIGEVLLGRHKYPFLATPQRRQAITAIAQLFHPRYKYDVLSLKDMGPGLALIANIMAKFPRLLKPLRTKRFHNGLSTCSREVLANP